MVKRITRIEFENLIPFINLVVKPKASDQASGIRL